MVIDNSPTEELLSFNSVSLELPTATGTRAIIEDLSLSVVPGEFVAIVGPSGCGKTTLLRLAHGLVEPTSGEVTFKGSPIHGPRSNRGFVFQSDRLLPWRTIMQNVLLPLEFMHMDPSVAKVIAQKVLTLTGLAHVANQFPSQLSGGMRQRVNLARALAIDPDVLFMDEPFAALDAQTRDVMQLELLNIWQRDRKTVLFVTHQLDEAVYLADRVIVLAANPGRVREIIDVRLPRPRNLDTKHSHEFNIIVNRLWNLLKEDILAAVE